MMATLAATSTRLGKPEVGCPGDTRAGARSIEVVTTAVRVRVSVLGGAQPRRREGRRAGLVLSVDD